jgi:hypothetical protein
MRRIFIGLALAGAVAGCATTGTISVTQNDIDAARSAYDAAFLAPAAAYRGLPLCASGQASALANPCASAATIEKLQAADQQVEQAFDAVQSLVSSGGGDNLVADYQALTQSVAAAEDLLSSLGIN